MAAEKNNSALENKKEKYWMQILAIAIGCIASLSDGLLQAWSSPFIVKIVNDTEQYNISHQEASYFAILPSFALMISCYLFAILFDQIGRKNTLLICAIPQLVAWLLTIVSKHLYVLYLSRIFAGIGSACLFVTLPVYVGEIASPKVRGFGGSLFTSISFLGQFLIHILGNYYNVQTTAYICFPLTFLFFILFFFMPESPYFYLMQKNNEDAKISLYKLKGREDVDDFLQLKTVVEEQLSEREGWKDLAIKDSNRKAILIGFFLRGSQQLGGMAIYTTSMQLIFERSQGSISSDIASEIFMCCTFLFYFTAGFFVDKLSRRKSYTISTLVCGVIFLLVSLYFYLVEYQPHIDISGLNLFPLAGLIFCLFIGSFGPGLLPSIMIGELFSTSIKAKAIILMVFAFGLTTFLVNNIFFLVNAATGLYGPFIIFGIVNLISSVLSFLYLPETNGKTLEEIQQLLK